METRKIFFTVVFFCFFVGIFVGGAEAKEPVLITQLGVAPWLGEIRSEYDLKEKIKGSHQEIVDFVLYDLKAGVKISRSEAEELVKKMVEGRWEKISIPDGTVFLSMGWKSRKSGEVMRTERPKLALGRSIQGYSITVEIPGKEAEVEYVVLQPCGNICLWKVRELLPPRAEVISTAPPPPAPTPPAPIPNGYFVGNYYPGRVIRSAPPPPPPPPPFCCTRCTPCYYSPFRITWSSHYHHHHHHHRSATPPTVVTRPPSPSWNAPLVTTKPSAPPVVTR